MNNTKSATTAGILGITLGIFGAHQWYLGNRNRALVHLVMTAGALAVFMLTSVILPALLSRRAFLSAEGVMTGLNVVAWCVLAANALWGVAEGIAILQGGDEALEGQNFEIVNQDQQLPEQEPNTPVILDLNENRGASTTGSVSSTPEVIFYDPDSE